MVSNAAFTPDTSCIHLYPDTSYLYPASCKCGLRLKISEKSLDIAAALFLQAGYPSCHPCLNYLGLGLTDLQLFAQPPPNSLNNTPRCRSISPFGLVTLTSQLFWQFKQCCYPTNRSKVAKASYWVARDRTVTVSNVRIG